MFDKVLKIIEQWSNFIQRSIDERKRIKYFRRAIARLPFREKIIVCSILRGIVEFDPTNEYVDSLTRKGIIGASGGISAYGFYIYGFTTFALIVVSQREEKKECRRRRKNACKKAVNRIRKFFSA